VQLRTHITILPCFHVLFCPLCTSDDVSKTIKQGYGLARKGHGNAIYVRRNLNWSQHGQFWSLT